VTAATTIDEAAEYEALLQFMYLAPVGLVQTSIDGEILFINPLSAQLLMPLSRDGALSNLFTALENIAPELRLLANSFAAQRGSICDAVRLQVNAGVAGSVDPKLLSLSLVKLDANRLMAVLSDITLQVKRERLLRQNEALLNAILIGATDYVLISLDRQGCITSCSKSAGAVTGFAVEALIGRPYSVFSAADATTPEGLLDRLREADLNGWSLIEGWRIRADGSQFWASEIIAPLQDPQDRQDRQDLQDAAYCFVMRDVSERREAGELLRRATSCDHLTGLANRRAFFEEAQQELTRWQRVPRELTLIMFDADHFKTINDSWGHPAGDAVLRDLAATLTATFRKADILARLGGEEFAVLMPSTGSTGALAVARRLLNAVAAQTVLVDGAAIRYTVSAGMATMDATVSGLDALIKRADVALYEAKKNGRNRVECWSSLPTVSPDDGTARRA
jgi:diguanylate cyclase (GGDEF)-like protein/PAS domain S-box-containing protein